jgi:hypothetical protein
MKKLLLTLAIAVLSLGGTSVANAETTCTISGTGPGSTSECNVSDEFSCTVTNDNDFTIVNNNTQEATSGTATNSDNTTSGGASSGSATNSNGTVIEVTIDNGDCLVAAVTPPAPVGGSGAVTPAAGGMGEVTPVAAPQKVTPAALPNTSAGSTASIVASLIAILGATVLGARFLVATYSKS